MKEKKYKKSLLPFRSIFYRNKFSLFLLFAIAVLVFVIIFSHSNNPNFVADNFLTNPLKINTAHASIIPSPADLIKWYWGSNMPTDIATETATGVVTGGTTSWWWPIVKYLALFLPRVFLFVVYVVCWLVYSLSYAFVYLSEGLLKLFFDPAFITSLGGFTTVDFVRSTAQIVANLCNMLYLFILLYIAIGTMFGIGGTSKLLTKLVIAALLTNFSLVISGIIIDFSQVLMHSFFSTGFEQSFKPGTQILSNLQDAWKVGKDFSMKELFDKVGEFLWSKDLTELINDMIKIMGLIIFSLVLVVTFVTITTLLVIRIVALWILLIVSPAAFASNVLPQTERYWKEWLETFTKYAFSGPILIFFLWLAIKVSEKVSNNSQLLKLKENVPDGNALRYTFYVLLAENATVVFQLLVLVLIVWAGILIANKFGIRGAKSLDQLMNSTKRVPGNITRRIGKATNIASQAIGRPTRFVGTWLSSRQSKKAENYLSQANVVASRGTPGSTEEAQRLRDKATEFTKKGGRINDIKNQILKMASTINLLNTKKLIASYLETENKNYYEHSEQALKAFWTKKIKVLLGERERLIINAGEASVATINRLSNEVIEKNNNKTDYQKDEIRQEQIVKNLNIDFQKAQDDEKKARDRAEALKKGGVIIPGETEEKRAERRKKAEEDVNKAKKIKEDLEKRLGLEIEKQKMIRDKKENAERELHSLGASIAEITANNDKEKEAVLSEYEKMLVVVDGKILDKSSFNPVRKVGEALGSPDLLFNNARKIGREDKSEELEDNLWIKEKEAKEVKESLKEIEDKKESFDAIKDKVKSGYGSPAMRTALFEKLASSSRHFGGLVKELSKDLGSEEKAIEMLKGRYSEPTVLKALKAVDEEGRKSNDLSQIGRVVYDSRIGKQRFANEMERENSLKHFARSMDAKAINKINKQSFDDEAGIKALAVGPDWVKLSKNENFKNLMTREVKDLFKSKKDKFEKHFDDNNDQEGKNAFITVLYG